MTDFLMDLYWSSLATAFPPRLMTAPAAVGCRRWVLPALFLEVVQIEFRHLDGA
jgi:hypothetical protein